MIIPNFGAPEDITEKVLEGLVWLDEVSLAGDGYSMGIHEEEGGLYDDDGDITVAGYAMANEFGTDTIPSRPFLRQPFDLNVDKYSKLSEEALFSESLEEANVIFAKVAEIARGDSLKAIAARVYQENAESTIDMKGSDMPLVDTGRLRQSILVRSAGGE